MIDDSLTKSADANQIITWILEARTEEKNFIIQGDETHKQKLEGLISQILALAKNMQFRFAETDKRQPLLDKIVVNAEGYLTAFRQYARLHAQQQLAEDDMSKNAGELRIWTNAIRLNQSKKLASFQQGTQPGASGLVEALATIDEVHQINRRALDVRIKEKDFIAQKDEKHRPKIAGLITQIVALAKKVKSQFAVADNAQTHLDNIIVNAETYFTAFEHYADVYAQQQRAEADMLKNARELRIRANAIRITLRNELKNMRKQADTFLDEKMANDTDASQLFKWFLDARNNEKEVIISGEQEFLNAVNTVLSTVILKNICLSLKSPL